MKSIVYLMTGLFLVTLFGGCKKDSFDPASKTRDDFIGTWKGEVTTFKNNKLVREFGTFVIYPNGEGDALSGIIFMKTTDIFHEFQFQNGTLYFKVLNNDPDNPNCKNWSLGGYAAFTADKEIEIHLSGNECGLVGNEYVNWAGNLMSILDPPDSVRYYSFAMSGHQWEYRAERASGDTCQIHKQIFVAGTEYSFTGTTVQSCGWGGTNLTLRWYATPAIFTVIFDSTLCYRSFSFPINAKAGVTYKTFTASDTTTVTLVDTNLMVNVPAGSFLCSKFKYTEPVMQAGKKTTRIAYLWLNNNFGVIRQEVENPDSNGIRTQELWQVSY